jgi:hypothetical protein
MGKDDTISGKKIHIFFPLIIIAIGLILLWQNIGGRSFDGWQLIFQFWPIILIFGGLENLLQGRGVAVNVFWFTLGLALLLSNLGRISWTIWEILLGFWPMVIIALGLDLMFGRYSKAGKLATGGIVLMVMGGFVYFFDAQSISPANNYEMIKQSRDNLDRAVVELKPSIGFLKIYAQSSESLLVEGKLLLWKGERITEDYKVADDIGQYTLASSGLAFIYEPGIGNRAGWEIGVNSKLPIDLITSQIVGEIMFEFSDMIIDSFASSLTLGTSEVTLPRKVNLSGEMNHSIGQIVIIVPQGTGLKLTGRPVIGRIDFPETYLLSGDQVISPQYDESENKVEIFVRMAIGKIIIRQR